MATQDDTTDATTKVEEVIAALTKARTEPDDETWLESTEIGVDWILAQSPSVSNPSSSSSSVAIRHYFHPSKETPFTTVFDVSAFLLRLLGFKANPSLAEWREGLELCLVNCCDCAREYYGGKKVLFETYLCLKYSEKSLADFKRRVEELDRKRIVDGLTKYLRDRSPQPLRLSSLPAPLIHFLLLSPSQYRRPEMLEHLKAGLPCDERLEGLPSPLPVPGSGTESSNAVERIGLGLTPGLLSFLVHEDDELRVWARAQVPKSKTGWVQGPLPVYGLGAPTEGSSRNLEGINELESVVGMTFQEIFSVLSILDRDRGDTVSDTPNESSSLPPFKYTLDTLAFWEGFHTIVSLVPAHLLIAPRTNSTSAAGSSRTGTTLTATQSDLIHFVCSHLSDTGPQFAFVLLTFTVLLQKFGANLWTTSITSGKKAGLKRTRGSTGDEEYAEVVLHNILDNSNWQDYLLEERALPSPSGRSATQFESPDLSRHASNRPLHFSSAWIVPFLQSISDNQKAFVSSLATISITLLDRLQHVRFDELQRSRAIKSAFLMFRQVFVPEAVAQLGSGTGGGPSLGPPVEKKKLRAMVDSTWPFLRQASSKLDVHAKLISQIAFDRKFTRSKEFEECTELAEKFLEGILRADAIGLRDAIYALSSLRGPAKPNEASVEMPRYSAHMELWSKTYETARTSTNPKAVAVLVRAVASCSHVPDLTPNVWLAGVDPSKEQRFRPGFKSTVKGVGDLLVAVKQPLSDLLVDLANEDPSTVTEFFRQPDALEKLAAFLFSPSKELHESGMALIKQFFDVTSRSECFQVLLQNRPESTAKGIISALETFLNSSVILPEACGSADRIVRCLNDMMEALCGAEIGLLRRDAFVAEGSMRALISLLWEKLCKVTSLIFDRTPSWAPFYDNEQMTDWMRVGILFAGQMVDQVLTFADAVSGNHRTSSSPSKANPAGVAMMENLNELLYRSLAWLRLTDVDLLGLTADLIKRLLELFSRSKIRLRTEVIKKLRSYATGGSKKTGLRPDQLESFMISIAKHPLHSKEVADLVDESIIAEEKKKEHKEWWAKAQESKTVNKGFKKAGTSKKRAGPSGSPTAPIEIDDDEDEDIITTSEISIPRPGPSKKAKPLAMIGKELASSKDGSRPRTLPKAGRPASTAPAKRMNFSHKQYDAAEESESSSSSEEEAGEKTGLSSLAVLQKSPKIKKQEQRRTILFEGGLPGRGGRFGAAQPSFPKSAERTARLRHAPDFSDLHRQILQWDYMHSGPAPTFSAEKPRKVPQSFATPQDYIHAFEPLLMLECWQQLLQAKEETTLNEALHSGDGRPVVQCEISSRTTVDDFTDIYSVVKRMPEKFYFSESDLVLLRQDKRCVMAKIQRVGRKKDITDVVMRCHLGRDIHQAGPALVPRSQWEILKLISLSTIYREYAALKALPYYDLVASILQPQMTPPPDPNPIALKNTMSRYGVNEPQARAILGVVNSTGFSLIQGPPGTGKTKTILGLVAAFIAKRARKSQDTNDLTRGDSQESQIGKVLLCAPSNAAIDEVARRLKEGFRGADGSHFIPKVVRIGSESSVDISIKDIFIDELVEREINNDLGSKTVDSKGPAGIIANIRGELDRVRGERDEKQTALSQAQNNDELNSKLQAELKALKQKNIELMQKLDDAKDKLTANNRAMDAARRKFRLKVLSEADVICTTLSGAGHDYMAQLPFDLETVIIDEAAQCVELSSLIPLKYGCQRCIMVGDPNQLPPTVLSRPAADAGYDQSLFIRLQSRMPEAVHLLSIQYRMHPSISRFPGNHFYSSKLADGPGMDVKTTQPWHANSLFPPYAFYHVRGGREDTGRNHSYVNREEASMALALYQRLTHDYPGIDFAYRVGIVTPYAGQVQELKRVFKLKFGFEFLAKIHFGTVDAYQGSEMDIIILSTVRAGKLEGGVGFLRDFRRMNVALTRAKSSLFILGDMNTLQKDKNWGALVKDAQARTLLREADLTMFSTSRLANLPPVVFSASNVPKIVKPPAKRPTAPTLAAGDLLTPKQLAEQISRDASGKKNDRPKAAETSAITPPTKPIRGLKRSAADDISPSPSSTKSDPVQQQSDDQGHSDKKPRLVDRQTLAQIDDGLNDKPDDIDGKPIDIKGTDVAARSVGGSVKREPGPSSDVGEPASKQRKIGLSAALAKVKEAANPVPKGPAGDAVPPAPSMSSPIEPSTDRLAAQGSGPSKPCRAAPSLFITKKRPPPPKKR